MTDERGEYGELIEKFLQTNSGALWILTHNDTLISLLRLSILVSSRDEEQLIDDSSASVIAEKLAQDDASRDRIYSIAQRMVWLQYGSPRVIGSLVARSTFGLFAVTLVSKLTRLPKRLTQRGMLVAGVVVWLPLLFDQVRTLSGRIPNDSTTSIRDFLPLMRQLYISRTLSGAITSAGNYSQNVFVNCIFEQLSAKQSLFESTVFEYSTWNGGWITSCNLASTLMYKTSIRNVVFVGCNLRDSGFRKCTLQDVHFINCNMNNAQLRCCKLERISFIDCTMKETRFSSSKCLDLYFTGCTIDERSPLAAIATSTDSSLLTRNLASHDFVRSVHQVLIRLSDEPPTPICPSVLSTSYRRAIWGAMFRELIVEMPRMAQETISASQTPSDVVRNLLTQLKFVKSLSTQSVQRYFEGEEFKGDPASTRESEIHIGLETKADVLRFCKYIGASASRRPNLFRTFADSSMEAPSASDVLRDLQPLVPGDIARVLPQLVLRPPYRFVASLMYILVELYVVFHEAVHISYDIKEESKALELLKWYHGDFSEEAIVDFIVFKYVAQLILDSLVSEDSDSNILVDFMEDNFGTTFVVLALLMSFGIYAEYTCLQRNLSAGAYDSVLYNLATWLASQVDEELIKRDCDFWLNRWSDTDENTWTHSDRAVTYFQTMTLISISHDMAQGGFRFYLRRHESWLREKLQCAGLLCPSLLQ